MMDYLILVDLCRNAQSLCSMESPLLQTSLFDKLYNLLYLFLVTFERLCKQN